MDKESKEAKMKYTQSIPENMNDDDGFDMDKLKEMFAPHRESLAMMGMTPTQGIGHLLAHFEHSTRDPESYLHNQAKGLGMKIQIMERPKPEVQHLQDAGMDVDAFLKKVKPDMAELAKLHPMMLEHLENGRASSLEEAHEMARMMHPDTRDAYKKALAESAMKKSAKNPEPVMKAEVLVEKKPKKTGDLSTDLRNIFRKA